MFSSVLHADELRRIVSFRPNITEILFALGLGERVVGVTTFCHYPPEAQKIEKIGGYTNRSLEKILSLKPDLVVLVPDSTTHKLEAALKRSGIDVLIVKADSITDMEASIRAIAQAADIKEGGERLIDTIQKSLKELSEKRSGHPRPKALLVIQRRPLIVAGGKTFLSELLDRAGADNIVESRLPYPNFSMEAVIARAPEIIFDLDATDTEDYWSRYASIPAVKNGKVVRLPADLFVPGPRLPEALKTMIDAMP